MSTDHKAYIEFITGPMFSGKTIKLITIANNALREKKAVLVIKPEIDDRYAVNQVVSHSGEKMEAVVISDCKQIIDLISDIDYLIIDEVQLFRNDLFEIILAAISQVEKIYCAGLNLDYRQKKFEISKRIELIADKVTLLHSVCELCNQRADYTFKKVETDNFVGGKEMYEPRCKTCYEQQ